jgi:hypothetical protein
MYNKIKLLNDEKFRRKTGVKRGTFNKILEIVTKAEDERRKVKDNIGGRPLTISYEDKILICLSYLREYTTYFTLGSNYGISESQCYKICRRVEDILIKSKVFNLPNGSTLYTDEEVKEIIIDATEHKIERPKKSKENTMVTRKNSILLKHK